MINDPQYFGGFGPIQTERKGQSKPSTTQSSSRLAGFTRFPVISQGDEAVRQLLAETTDAWMSFFLRWGRGGNHAFSHL